MALPEADAFDFLRFCVQNPKPCPVLDVTDAGSPEPAQVAPGADLRTDCRATGSGATASWSTSRWTRASTDATTSSAS